MSPTPSPHMAPDNDNPLAKPGNSLALSMIEKVGVPVLERLRDLRDQGWQREELDEHFKDQRATAAAPSEDAQRAWYFKMKKAFRELDEHASFVPRSGPFDFLDLGCCPGSFTSYILSASPQAHGTGISLPVEQGGHPYTLERELRPRFKLHWGDLIYFQLHPSASELRGQVLRPLPAGLAGFDLVILDGHWLHIYASPSLSGPERWDAHRLMISQIIIALRAVRHGGTIVMKLSHPERTTTAQILFLLDVLSKDLTTWKPRVIHSNRATFYAVASGIGLGPRGDRKAQYLREFEELWREISFGGEEGRGRWFGQEDLNFIVSHDELVDGCLERLAELGKDPWTVQADTLERWFARKGLPTVIRHQGPAVAGGSWRERRCCTALGRNAK